MTNIQITAATLDITGEASPGGDLTGTVTASGFVELNALESMADVQAAIDSISAAGGGVVDVPAGVFVGQLVLRSNVLVRGAGPATVFTIPANATLTPTTTTVGYGNETMRAIVRTEHGCHDATLADVRIDGNGAAQNPAVRQAGLLIVDADRIVVRDVSITDVNPTSLNATGANSFGVLVNDSADVSILGGRYERCGYECIGIRDGSRDVRVIGATARDGAMHAFQAAFCAAVSVVGCRFDQVNVSGFSAAAFHRVGGATMSGCVVRGNRVVVLDGSTHIQIIGNQVDAPSVAVTVTGSVGVQIAGNSLAATTGVALSASHYALPSRVQIAGNTIDATTTVQEAGATAVIVGDNL